MARGRKKQEKITLAEQLKSVEAQISSLEEQLKDMRAKKKELLQKIKEEEKEKLYNAVVKSGKSIDEVITELYGEEKNN